MPLDAAIGQVFALYHPSGRSVHQFWSKTSSCGIVNVRGSFTTSTSTSVSTLLEVLLPLAYIPIWKWLITVSIGGLRSSGSPFPYGDHRMEMGIDASLFPYGDYPVPNPFPMVFVTIWEFRKNHHMRIINHLVSLFPYMVIPVWKGGGR
jgi:hypothetical protein